MKLRHLLLAIATLVFLVGCGSSPVVGTWTTKLPNDKMGSMTFKGDKTFELTMEGLKDPAASGTWELKDKVITMTGTKTNGTDIPPAAQKPETATLSEDGKSITIMGLAFNKK